MKKEFQANKTQFVFVYCSDNTRRSIVQRAGVSLLIEKKKRKREKETRRKRERIKERKKIRIPKKYVYAGVRGKENSR